MTRTQVLCCELQQLNGHAWFKKPLPDHHRLYSRTLGKL